ncbi:MAG TPA: serpin family protein [Candidatus Limnocylindrales bacterium]|nr:serpin family protein [Candidatus Limnocylindrales bacterium]
MIRRPAILATLLLAVVTACSSSSSVGLAMAAAPRASVAPADAIAAADALNAFGFDLLRGAVASGGNGVISPASIAIALGMARPGARGTTATQMDAVMRALASDDHASWLNALDAALASRTGTFKDAVGKDEPVTLRIANATFAQRDLQIEPAYLDALASRFGSGVRLVEYRTSTEAARQAINSWVSDQTEARIPELIDKGDLDQLTRLVLVNAIYLKAAWLTPFDPALTAPAPFTTADGTSVDVATMHGTTDLAYASGTGWRAVELPYVGGQLALTIIVPDDLAAFVKGLDGPTFRSITGALTETSVDLSLPKFGTETKIDLASLLASLGMPDAFDPVKADFSGITTAEQLYISAVIHQANIDVDEKGTTASAATAVAIRASALPSNQVELHVDQPFLFALRDVETGAIVFIGQITSPSPRDS